MAQFSGVELEPGPDVLTDEQIDAFVREYAQSIFHPVGTCRMGTDAGSVVDPELKVRGISGLRVADASIIPTIIAGNTNAPAIMIGRKAAALIRNDQA